jgi:GABA permease
VKERSLHNPLRSETEVFRAVVVVGVAIALLVAVAAIAGSTAAAVLFFCLLAAGGWVLWHRSQGGEPVDAEVASAPDHAHHRVLVVANQTVGGAALLAEIAKRCAGRSAEVHVIAPALTNSQLEHWASDTDEAATSASERLNASVEAIRKLGVRATGDVGDQDPNVALQDGLRAFAADEVIISTHPRERSRWLEHGVVEKARATVPLPVTHVVVDLDAEAAVSAR